MIGIQAPYKYLQGPGIMNDLAKHVKHLGNKFLILAGKTIMKKKQEPIENSFKDIGLECEFVRFNGEVTTSEYKRIADIATNGNFDVIIGLGGGKTIDTAKAAANLVNVPFVSAPSTASNDAPCSSLSVIYNDEGHVIDVELYKNNPALIVVDSEIIADAPISTLVAGMGDALATYYEARVCVKYGFKNAIGTSISNTAIALGELCYNILLDNGYLAKQSVEAGLVSQPLENIIEANTYLSGIGFESGGLSCAHSIQDALTTIKECHDNTMHGDRVAFGTICLLILDNCWEEVFEVMDFCMEVGLPITFNDLYITENVEEKIRSIVPIAYTEGENICKAPPGTNPEKVFAAMMLADKLGRQALSED